MNLGILILRVCPVTKAAKNMRRNWYLQETLKDPDCWNPIIESSEGQEETCYPNAIKSEARKILLPKSDADADYRHFLTKDTEERRRGKE